MDVVPRRLDVAEVGHVVDVQRGDDVLADEAAESAGLGGQLAPHRLGVGERGAVAAAEQVRARPRLHVHAAGAEHGRERRADAGSRPSCRPARRRGCPGGPPARAGRAGASPAEGVKHAYALPDSIAASAATELEGSTASVDSASTRVSRVASWNSGRSSGIGSVDETSMTTTRVEPVGVAERRDVAGEAQSPPRPGCRCASPGRSPAGSRHRPARGRRAPPSRTAAGSCPSRRGPGRGARAASC